MDELAVATAEVAAVAGTCAGETERLRRLAPPVVDAIRRSGLNRLVSPSALGGDAADPRSVVDVIETISRSDASAGWCVGIGMGSNFLSGLMDESESRVVFTDLDGGAAGPFAPGGHAQVTPDGYHVTGRWPFSSNCHQAKVVGAGIMAFDGGRPSELDRDGRPIVRLGFFTDDQFEIVETWDTVGLRGTGSHDLTLAGADLPRERTATLFDTAWPDDALFRLRTFDVLGPSLAAVPLGIGRAALDIVAARAAAEAEGPPAMGPRPRLCDDSLGQLEYARAELRLRAARALLMEAMGACYAHALVGDTPPRRATALVGLSCFEALTAGVDAVATAVRLSGTAAVREGSPLEQLRRDIDTAGSHVMFSPTGAANLGRELSGVPTRAHPVSYTHLTLPTILRV